MLKWFAGKSLRFQLSWILMTALAVPLLAVGYNLFFSAAAERLAVEERRERLSQLLENVGTIPRVTLADASGAKPGGQEWGALRAALEKAVPPPRVVFPARIGIYFPQSGASLASMMRRGEAWRWGESKLLPMEKEFLARASQGGKLEDMLADRRIQMYVLATPLEKNGELLALAWAQEALPSLLETNRSLHAGLLLFSLLGLGLAFAGALAMLGSLVGGTNKVRRGLEALQQDLSHRLPDLPGEMGQVSRAINRMAASLEEKAALEEQLRRSERLALLGRLVAGLAHEIRNPLGIIRATSQVMIQEHEGDPGLSTDVAVILEQVDRQNRVIQGLLDFARPASPRRQPLDLAHLLESVLSFSRSYLKQQEIKLRLEIPAGLPLLEGDGEQLKQVFLNLILNAAEAMPGGGQLLIGAVEKDGLVAATFTDSGEGITGADLPHIFEPFYTTKGTGTGLGLAISQQIIELHGGRIEVESVSGKGTSFTIFLPLEGKEGEGNAPSDSGS